MFNVAVLGYGTVGSGVVKVINDNNQVLKKFSGEEINVKYVLDLRDFPGDPVEKILVHDYEAILADDDVKCVVEVMGGVEPANKFVRQAIEKGKSVCTSNKELVARYGAEILQLAKDNNVAFLFEASVGGGIPVIRSINESLTADNFDSIAGILNGTTNYMLTKMSNEDLTFDEVLKDAQDKGYAERNPEADVEGYDACRKIAILTSLICGQQVDFEDISTEGITGITKQDIYYSKKLGLPIKLLGLMKKENDKVYAMVAPFMLENDHCLRNVDGVYNAVSLHGDMLGDVMLYGQGAGSLPTASAVVSDVVEIAKNNSKNIPIKWAKEKVALGDITTFKARYFVRVEGEGQSDKLRKTFENACFAPQLTGETAFVTATAFSEKEIKEKLDGYSVLNLIRIAE
ncbi:MULTISPECIES: homoserine dehydrogenase [Eubacterium]|uniref:Homoserine dehydrogenase n=1 Tax=Eubacterium ruminantium TaxID=42322 RepID=A0A1T4QLJ8_9FIRM|nr:MULTISPECIES: homoserine dehydrogenase [Eubacterium]MCR5367516.1 homoserine dehydrogenase [Eubacterium sp.]SCW68598.1 homoserine dehydrogenase [Eubacterium ruminantium]SDN41358.1 homoserine dehydrogenase [Eubacterium ruminantium]SKA04595.1 homoserine dehydrogenase [Eubacterium ruminantium]